MQAVCGRFAAGGMLVMRQHTATHRRRPMDTTQPVIRPGILRSTADLTGQAMLRRWVVVRHPAVTHVEPALVHRDPVPEWMGPTADHSNLPTIPISMLIALAAGAEDFRADDVEQLCNLRSARAIAMSELPY